MRVVLGIESSCDETAAALVTEDRRILAQAIASQDDQHSPYGGVVPEIAARAHAERLAPLIERVLNEAQVGLKDVDAVAATAGPGLIGGVMVGLVTAKALAMASDKPLLAINHLEGHALSPRLADPELQFPYALLLVSGGHCQLLEVSGVGQYRRLATTKVGASVRCKASEVRSTMQSTIACWKLAAMSAELCVPAATARCTALLSPANEKCGSSLPSSGRGRGTALGSPSRASVSTAGPPG